MKRREISLLVFILISVFILVYSPHFNYRFPYFIDEWHHISQSYNLFEEGYFLGSGKLEIGFQLFLRILSLKKFAIKTKGEKMKSTPVLLYSCFVASKSYSEV